MMWKVISEQDLMLRFGLSAEEGAQEIEFNGRRGTVAQMLADEVCPVGRMIESAHSEGGVEAVRQKFEGINGMFGSNLPTDISEKSPQQYETAIEVMPDVKKN